MKTDKEKTVKREIDSSGRLPRDRSRWPEVSALIDIGSLFYQRGWSVGTSGNYSVVLGREPLRLLITASQRDKRALTVADFLVVDESGKALLPDEPKPSAETMLHITAARQPDVGAVLHTHSVWATMLSDLYFADGGLAIEGYEMLKGLQGIESHVERLWLEIFENSQDIPELATKVGRRFVDPANPLQYGFLIRRHGLYTWGRDLNEARRHVEILEFLLEVVGRRLSCQPDLAERYSRH